MKKNPLIGLYSVVLRRVDSDDSRVHSTFELTSQFLDDIVVLTCNTEKSEKVLFECFRKTHHYSLTKDDYNIYWATDISIQYFVDRLGLFLDPYIIENF